MTQDPPAASVAAVPPAARVGAVPRALRSARVRRHAGSVAALWLIALALVAGFMVNSRTVSPIDEAAHLDYVLRMPEQFPAAGQRMLPETRQIWSCRGTEVEIDLPACGNTPGAPGRYPGAAYGLAGSHPPLYYLVTDVVGNVLHAVTPLDRLDSYRAVGVLWLGGALTASYALAVVLGATRRAAFGLTVMVASTATVVWQSGALGNDIASWLVGAGLLLGVATYRRTWPHALLLVLAAVLVAATKQTGFLAVGAGALALVLRAPLTPAADAEAGDGPAATGRLHGWWADWLVAIAMVVAFSVPSLWWTFHAAGQAVGDQSAIPQNQRFAVEDGWPWGDIAQQAVAFLTPVSDPAVGSYLSGKVVARLGLLATGPLVIGLLAAVCAGRARPRASALGIGLLVVLLLGGPMLAAANYGLSESFFDLNRRYAFAVLGGLIACGAAIVETPWMRRAYLVGGLVMLGATLLFPVVSPLLR